MTDILLTDNDLAFTDDGDFILGDSEQQHIEHLLQAAPGNYFHDPILGANLRAQINGPGTVQETVANIQKQLVRDGFTKAKVTSNDGEIKIDNGVL